MKFCASNATARCSSRSGSSRATGHSPRRPMPTCGRVVALLTNPMETQLVASLGVKIGGTTLPPQPMEMVRGMVATGKRTPSKTRGSGERGAVPLGQWRRRSASPESLTSCADGQADYLDYAKDRGIAEITPAVMDTARTELGLEGCESQRAHGARARVRDRPRPMRRVRDCVKEAPEGFKLDEDTVRCSSRPRPWSANDCCARATPVRWMPSPFGTQTVGNWCPRLLDSLFRG